MVVGQMVIAHQRLMKVVDIVDDVATLKFIDLDGVVQIRSAPVSSLATLWTATRPKALWPEAGHLDEVIAEREEREAAAARKAAKRASRKAKRSNKIKRKAAA